MLRSLLAAGAAFAALPAHALNPDPLIELVNAYRAAPGICEGRQARPLAPLAAHPALSNLQVGAGVFLDQALARAGYPVAQAKAIYVNGAPDARGAMDEIISRYCKTLLSTQFSAAGAARSGGSWQLILAQLAQPAPPSRLSLLDDWRNAGLAILNAVNTARASARNCGERRFAAAPALAWSEPLGAAALAHSVDMASQRYFDHQSKDGRAVAERALQAGYLWRRIGENIAVGQEAPDDVVAGWLDSPGHCANIMDPGFADMGAAYAVNAGAHSGRAYWTQVLGMAR